MEKNIWKKFEMQIVGIILVTVLFLTLSFYYLIYNQYYKLTISNLQDDAYIVHQYAEEIINEESFISLNTIEDENEEIYLTTHAQLDEIRRIANIRYLYTAKQDKNGQYIYVLDGLNRDAEDFRHVGDLIEEEIIPELGKCLKDEVVLDTDIKSTEWGAVYVTYFPVHAEDGRILGAIGMEFDCEKLYRSFHRVKVLTIIISIFLAAVCILTAIVILKQIVKNTENILDKKDAMLIAAKEEAVKSSKAKSDFLSRMSHEIRTPMNAIIGMTAIAENTSDINKIKKCLSTINTSSVQLLGLINDILDMSKIEAGKFELSLAPMNLKNILDKVSSFVMDSIEKKHQTFDMKTERDIGGAYIGDELKISQILTNLLSNAVKFTPEGKSVSLIVEKVQCGSDFDVFRFSVKDTGIGIAKEQIDKLFQSFEQGSSDTSRKYGGTGLGLAISKNLVEKMGGKIWVESEVNQGSVFSFEIKLNRSEIEASGPDLLTGESHNGESVESEAAPDFSGMNMLLVEDNEINREIVTALLETTHINIDIAENGLIAVQKVKENPSKYQIIFMDIQMPEMDGFEATRVIRGLGCPEAERIPIVALTANAFNEDVDKCISCGMNGHLAKPVNYRAICNIVNRYHCI